MSAPTRAPLARPICTPEALERLRRLRARLAKPMNWTKGVLARDARGQPVDYYHSHACKWCLVGALSRDFGPGTSAAMETLERLTGGLARFNDSHMHDEVIAKIESAIALVEAGLANQGANDAQK